MKSCILSMRAAVSAWPSMESTQLNSAQTMSQVSTGYRILSFIGLGGLLIGTSVVYGKVSPRVTVGPAQARR